MCSTVCMTESKDADFKIVHSSNLDCFLLTAALYAILQGFGQKEALQMSLLRFRKRVSVCKFRP